MYTYMYLHLYVCMYVYIFQVSTPVRGHARVDIWGWSGVGWDVKVHCNCN